MRLLHAIFLVPTIGFATAGAAQADHVSSQLESAVNTIVVTDGFRVVPGSLSARPSPGINALTGFIGSTTYALSKIGAMRTPYEGAGYAVRFQLQGPNGQIFKGGTYATISNELSPKCLEAPCVRLKLSLLPGAQLRRPTTAGFLAWMKDPAQCRYVGSNRADDCGILVQKIRDGSNQ